MKRLILLPLFALAACGDPIESGQTELEPMAEPPPSVNVPAPRSELPPPSVAPDPAAPAAPAVDPNTPVSAPAGGRAANAFVGRWAASNDLCANGAFVLTAESLRTAGEVSCDFQDVTATRDGWTIQASCRAEGPPQPATLQLAERGGLLTITGAPFEPIPLRRCPAAAAAG